MKKLFYSILGLGLVLATSCNPMEDIYTELDKTVEPIVGSAEYTLTEDDYETLGRSGGNFSSEEQLKASELPALLKKMYPVWGKNSSVLINYELFLGYPVSVRMHSLDQDDYATSGSDLLGFQSDAKPEDFLPAIIDNNVSSSEGKYAVAKYFQYTGAAYSITPTVIVEENFDYGATAGDFTTVQSNWTGHSGSSPYVGYSSTGLSMTGYPSSGTGGSITIGNPGGEDVNRVFPEVTSGTVYSSALVNISAVVSSGDYFLHFMPASGFTYSGRVGAKDNGSGKIIFGVGATSSSLTYGTTGYDLNTTYLIVTSYNSETGVSNLYVLDSAVSTEPTAPEATNSGGTGASVTKIAVRQDSKDGPTGTIDGVRVANTWSAIMSNETLDDEVIGEKEAMEAFYMYSGGSWGEPSDRFYFVSDADFDSMGEGPGEPGEDDTFKSSISPNDYLAVFLGLKFPYAKDGDELDVCYDYESSSSGKQVRGDLYTFNDGKWSKFPTVISTSMQYGHDGVNWVPDNTIKYTLVPADYTYMADQLTGNSDYDNVSLPNLSSYSDFDYNWEDWQILEALGILMDHLDPGAAEGQKYLLTYLLYDNGIQTLTISIIKTGGKWVLND